MDTKLKQFLKTIKLNESMLSMLFGIVTVILVGVLVVRMYSANRASITSEGEQTEVQMEKVGEVLVETGDDGQKYPALLADKVEVKTGDTLWSIATKEYGSGYNWVDIARENELSTPDLLVAGQELKLPKVAIKMLDQAKVVTQEPEISITGDSYTVVKGDHLWSIALRAYGDGYRWVEIAELNAVASPNYIEVGQVLKLSR